MTMKSISEQQRGGNAICSLCDDYMYSSQLNYDVVYIEMAGSLNHLKNGWRTWIQKPYIVVSDSEKKIIEPASLLPTILLHDWLIMTNEFLFFG